MAVRQVTWALPTILAVSCLLLGLSANIPAQEAGKKLPIPSEQEQAKSQELITDIFEEDFQNAKTPEAKSKLAKYLFQQGKESIDSNSNRYMLYLHTKNLAADAGNISLAMQAVGELDRQFRIDGLQMKAEVLEVASKSVTEKETSRELAELALKLIQEAVEDDNYKAAEKLGAVAMEAARNAKSVKLVVSVQKRNKEVDTLRQRFAKLQVYLDRLAKNPNDSEANLEMGRYFGLLKGKWEKALPLLAKGSDAGLKKQAKADLENPKDSTEQVAVADGWWEMAEKQEDQVKVNMQQRAAYWYSKALPKLLGLNRTKAIRRIDEVSATAAGPILGVALGPPGKVGELRRLVGHTQEIKSVAFSPDGRLGLSGAVDNRMMLWDLKEGKQKKTFTGHTKQVWGVAFHPNRKEVVSSSWDATARLWDMQSGQEIRRYMHPVDVNGVALSRDGKYMLVGCDDRFMQLWDVNTGQQLRRYTGANNFVYGVAFSPNGQYVACGSLDQAARVYNKATGQLVKQFQQRNAVYVVEFSPDSKYLFSCGDDAVHKWEIATGKEVQTYRSPSGWMTAMDLSQDGRRLLTGGDDRTVRLWDVNTGKEIKSFTGHSDQVVAVALSPDGRYALTGDYSGNIILWALPKK